MRRGDVVRAIAAGSALAGLLVAAYAVGTGWHTQTARAPAQQGDDDRTIGPIVFMPVLGNTCRQNLIDNRTGEVRENGSMPCNEALATAAQRRAGSTGATRLDIIRDSFRKSSQ